MCKNLLLSLAVVVLLSGGLQAQSSSRGGSHSTSMNRKKERMMAAEINKAADKIAKEQFAGIKLDKSQRDMLRDLTKSNYKKMTSLDSQIARLIPQNKIKKLQRMYIKAMKEGQDEKAAMMTSMNDIELSERTQQKVVKLNESKAKIVSKITAGVSKSLTEEQQTMLAEKMAMKKESAGQDADKDKPSGNASK